MSQPQIDEQIDLATATGRLPWFAPADPVRVWQPGNAPADSTVPEVAGSREDIEARRAKANPVATYIETARAYIGDVGVAVAIVVGIVTLWKLATR